MHLNIIFVSSVRRTSATQNSIDGVLLSAKYSRFPGTITFVGTNAEKKSMYKFGTAEAGQQLSPVVHTALPYIKACSKLAGGALVLQFNAEGRTDSLIDFRASTLESDMTAPGFCFDLTGVNPAFPFPSPMPHYVSLLE